VGDLVPSGDPNLALFVGIMLAGFVVGTIGHIVKSRALILLGIATIFAATIVLPLLIFGGDGS
jgi:hypothetical protein